ncbi:UDP-N-acetylmuramoyl-L-alanyl-D-glutamate--2,6-diaminopimelate ligase [Sulfurospirillum arcachonense]|uniref:UDP-N-acetylmuramoyl-L-alanyl-D-glutamate--2, 6-diaminopimelate ligase n=1 Tax=Sulfurospirillum arcachonense TaxID=57666 RepID=UPI0004693613|nr:UDP-N-acetylmuramoyl-L-alanyl-D-glutamate--2,6-diaminopimelate ligase [Sulfurospirillum arcachonense]
MIIEVENFAPYNAITDDSTQCNENIAFVLTHQNQKYLDDVKNKPTCKIITPKDCLDILGIKSNIKIIGITGTNGKTTTAAAIYSILLDLNKKVAMQGTRGCFINDKKCDEKSLTTPPILQTMKNIKNAIDEGCEYFVMEVSSHAIEQKRIEGLEFALKVFTNVTQDHLDYHGSLDAYIAVKSSFFEDETPKLINKDDGKIRFNRKNCMTYGADNPATYKVAAYSLKNGVSAVLQKFDKMQDFHSSIHGFFNLYNLVAAIGAIDMLEVASLDKICAVIDNFGGVEGRMEVVSENPLVIVDFAHTPDGMDKVLDSLKEKEMIVVFGAGGDRDKSKRPKMGNIAARYGKKVIVTSDNPRSEDPKLIIEDILTGIKSCKSLHVEVDRKKAIEYALSVRENDEIIVILGKGDETYQEIKGEKFPFDDRKIVKKIVS